MKRLAATLLLLATLLPVALAQSPTTTAVFPKAGRTEPETLKEMTRLLKARGITPTRLVIVEAEWQLHRDSKSGFPRQRTINAALLYRGEGGTLYRRFALFAVKSLGRGRFGSLELRDLGKPVLYMGR